MEIKKLKSILEAVLLAADRALTVIHLEGLFELDEERPTRDEIRKALHEMEDDYKSRGYELKHVASGFRLQVRQEYATWVGRLWEEKPARYTRALLETMSLIAYRQPITRGEIEEVRGVSVSSNIVKTLLERDWIKVLGHKDVPGKPTLYGTTKEFLDYFNLKTLDQLPTLAEIKDLDSIHPELELDDETIKDGTTPDDTTKPDSANDVNQPEASTTEGATAEDDVNDAGIEAANDGQIDAASDVDDTVNEEAIVEEAIIEEVVSQDSSADETLAEEVEHEQTSPSDDDSQQQVEQNQLDESQAEENDLDQADSEQAEKQAFNV